MNKKAIIICLAAGAVAVCAMCFFIFKGKQAQTAIETETIMSSSIQNVVTATGTVEPVQQVEIGTQVSGTIEKIYVDYNSEVKKGQLLAVLDKTNYTASLASARTDSASNRAELDYQEKNYKRIKELYEKNAVSDSEYDQAEYLYKKAYYAYQKSQAQIVTAKTNLGYCYIYSPIDGVVLSRAVDEGQTVASSFNTPTLFTIAQDLSKMQVIAAVDEADIGEVKIGQRVTFTVDAYPEATFDGIVTQVRLEATTTSNVVTYSVEIDAPNPDLKLKPGLTANVMIYVKEINDRPVISAQALNFEMPASDSMPQQKSKALQDNQRRVWVKEGDDIKPRIIEIGDTDGVNYIVTSGLNVGEKVVIDITEVKQKEAKKNTAASPFMPKRNNKNYRR